MSTVSRDLKHVWHPCSQMKDYATFEPLHVVSAKGGYLHLKDGRKLIDAISSWWCKSLGHNHPRLKSALLAQIERFEHVLLANTTNQTIVELSEKLAQLTPSLDKAFYASEGSSAVEIALKMSLHAQKIRGQEKRNKFVSLENSYHGETLGALSVSDIGLYKKPYASLLFEAPTLSPLPYVDGIHHPLWKDCQHHWEKIERQLEPLREEIAAIIIEPIVQGAGGMRIYSQDLLTRLRTYTKKHGIYLIADEIMTGFGRTGKMLACDHAGIEPDFLCLSKGLTSGWLPLSVVLTGQPVYELFYDDYETGNAFLHSHTFAGNALAASVALAVFEVFKEEKICTKAMHIGERMHTNMLEIAENTKKLTRVRTIGAITAADLVCSSDRRMGFEVFKKAVDLGAMLRPLGNTIYWLPPLISDQVLIDNLKTITEGAILATDFF